MEGNLLNCVHLKGILEICLSVIILPPSMLPPLSDPVLHHMVHLPERMEWGKHLFVPPSDLAAFLHLPI